MPDEIKIAIVEDQRKLRDGLAAIINGTSGFRTSGQFGSMDEALAKVEWGRARRGSGGYRSAGDERH